jgi:hypothetical protein
MLWLAADLGQQRESEIAPNDSGCARQLARRRRKLRQSRLDDCLNLWEQRARRRSRNSMNLRQSGEESFPPELGVHVIGVIKLWL